MSTDTGFTTVEPSGLTSKQRAAFDFIRSVKSDDFDLEFSTDVRRRVFFSLRSDKYYRGMVMGTVGPRGGLKLTVYPMYGGKLKRTGCSAYTAVRVYAS